eukprot:TRINITY_DN3682_c0_g1_i3.p1 TRINITY_DN3682_c0_g1~~TRINITY_DN3682_c0_g1_i3.p1  ORF type:complete len:354 (-),score=70.67 TRINITY_DN3682_c0_g1_i3:65-1126(-)
MQPSRQTVSPAMKPERNWFPTPFPRQGSGSSSTSASTDAEQDTFEESYTLTQEFLGKGASGTVCKAVSAATGKDRAVKVIDLIDTRDPHNELNEDRLADARCEEKLLQQLGQHKHCVSLLRSFLDVENKTFIFVMEKCDRSVMDAAKDVFAADNMTFLCLWKDALSAVAHMHRQQIVHRDLKPENMLLAGPDLKRIKICDFGLATRAPKNRLLTGKVGTLPYMSPEMAFGGGHSLSTDVWSMGATIYLFTFGELPYTPKPFTRNAVMLAIVTGQPVPAFRRCCQRLQERPDRLLNLLPKLLQRNHTCRPGAEESSRILRGSVGVRAKEQFAKLSATLKDKIPAAQTLQMTKSS